MEKNPDKNGHNLWSTKKEIEFIETLGRFRGSRLDKLLSYQSAAYNRVRWGKIDKDEIFKVLSTEIDKEWT